MVDNISGNNGNSGDSRNVNNANMINGTGKNAGNARSGRRKDFYGKRNGSDQMANKGGYLNKNGSGKDNYSNYSKDNKSGLKDGKLGRESAKNGYKENNSLLKGSGIRRDGGAARVGGMQNSGLPYRDSGRGKSEETVEDIKLDIERIEKENNAGNKRNQKHEAWSLDIWR